MADIDYGKLLDEMKDAVLGPVKASANKFLEDNEDAKEFLEDRASRLAELGVEFVKASGEEREKVKTQMEVVQQSIRNELSQIAVGASTASRRLFGNVLEAAVGVLIKLVPAVVGAL